MSHTSRRSCPVRIPQHTFIRMMLELERRSLHRREAGAFLLGKPSSEDVVGVAYYDDLDSNCLTGGITFHARGYTNLNRLCRDKQVEVVADIHLHPRNDVRQSSIDAAHPMLARTGHLALIAPQFGMGVTQADRLGAHMKTADGWTEFVESAVAEVFVIQPTVRGQIMRLLSMLRRGATRN